MQNPRLTPFFCTGSSPNNKKKGLVADFAFVCYLIYQNKVNKKIIYNNG